ncbi:MAG: hypothetical protein ACYDHG_05820 [Desulfomonilaceae bacterium]
MIEHTIRKANWGIWALNLQQHWGFVNQIWADIFGHSSIKNEVLEKNATFIRAFSNNG